MKHIKSTMPVIMRVKGIRCALWKHDEFLEITAQTDNIELIDQILEIFEKKYKFSSFTIHKERIPHAHLIFRK